jgi:hypothetical protein
VPELAEIGGQNTRGDDHGELSGQGESVPVLKP